MKERLFALLSLSALLAACAPATTPVAVLLPPADPERLAYVRALAWGSVSQYEAAYADRASTELGTPGLNWSRDGCSAPSGLDLGYAETFRPACNQHDFGYRNLKVLERTPHNRETTDRVFYTSMVNICRKLPWIRRPECHIAALIYESGVRLGGHRHF